MKTIASMLTVLALLAGCASLEEAYYVDREFGKAQIASWDKHVAYPDYRFAAETPQGIEGITSEEIMGVYNETFAQEPVQTEVFQFDITQ